MGIDRKKDEVWAKVKAYDEIREARNENREMVEEFRRVLEQAPSPDQEFAVEVCIDIRFDPPTKLNGCNHNLGLFSVAC